jgi:Fe-S cluster assembly ATP-binding protein
LRVQRSERSVLDGFDVKLAPGELIVLCVRGRDKPTDIAAALTGAGRYRVLDGQLLLRGEDVGWLDAMQRARRGMILTDPQRTVAGVTVTNHLWIGLQEQHEEVGPQVLRKRLLEALQELGLDNHFAGRTLPEALPFSDGLRLVLLTLGVVRPAVAIFPVGDTDVDLDAVRLLVEGLQKVERGETGVVLVTCDERLTQELAADQKLLFEAGQVVAVIADEP